MSTEQIVNYEKKQHNNSIQLIKKNTQISYEIESKNEINPIKNKINDLKQKIENELSNYKIVSFHFSPNKSILNLPKFQQMISMLNDDYSFNNVRNKSLEFKVRNLKEYCKKITTMKTLKIKKNSPFSCDKKNKCTLKEPKYPFLNNNIKAFSTENIFTNINKYYPLNSKNKNKILIKNSNFTTRRQNRFINKEYYKKELKQLVYKLFRNNKGYDLFKTQKNKKKSNLC